MLVLAAVLFAGLAPATPAWAQEVGVAPPGRVIYSQGMYTVTEDGFLIIDGDVALLCSEVDIAGASPADQPPGGYTSEEARAQAQQARTEQIRACQAAGFPPAADASPSGTSASDNASSPSGASTPTNPAPQNASPSASAGADAGAVLLPGTGGFALPALLVLASGVTLTGGLLARRARRR